MANENETSGIITLSSGAGADVKGSWVEMINPVSWNSFWVHLLFGRSPEFANEAKLDIANGTPEADNIVIPDLPARFLTDTDAQFTYFEIYNFPWKFSANDIISMRVSDEEAARSYPIAIRIFKDQEA